jgi:uncharacterized protein
VLALVLACFVLSGCALPSGSTQPSPSATPPRQPLTLRTLADADLGATTLQFGDVTARTTEYTTTAVTYASDGATASASLSIPTDDGPHPGIVLVHGIVNPRTYLPGSGMMREQDYFAREGYVALSLDLRSSTAAPSSAAALGIDLGSTLDVINGVRALQSAELPALDGQRIALLGHSLGGLLVLNTMVARPDLADAVVALAPASTDPGDNVEHLTALFGDTPAAIQAAYGTPEQNPGFWNDISPRSMVDRAEASLLIAHGTADEIVPIAWSDATTAVWEAAGKEVEFVRLPDEGHIFQARWQEVMQLASEFISAQPAAAMSR